MGEMKVMEESGQKTEGKRQRKKGKVQKKWKNASLKQSFIGAMLCTVAAIAALSVLTIWGCFFLQKIIMPDSNMAYLQITNTYPDGTEDTSVTMLEMGAEEMEIPFLVYTDAAFADSSGPVISKCALDKIENSYDQLTPKRKIAYSILSCAMVVLPFCYSVAGVIICALWFYRRKIEPSVRILSEAAENITHQDLNFVITSDSRDELGRLCNSFENMRQALYENNREMWNMIHERRMLQASVAHDLRNPIAIIQGYTEYLQLNLSRGKLSQEKLSQTLQNLSTAAKRLEYYTDSIRDLSKMEEVEADYKKCKLPDLLEDMCNDFIAMAGTSSIHWKLSTEILPCEVQLDQQMLYRILENIISNAIRYARNTIWLEFSLGNREEETLNVGKEKENHPRNRTLLKAVVTDDGPGFPEKVLSARDRYFITTEQSGNHLGMGLVVSRILCRKHGGSLKLANSKSCGASVTVEILLPL